MREWRRCKLQRDGGASGSRVVFVPEDHGEAAGVLLR